MLANVVVPFLGLACAFGFFVYVAQRVAQRRPLLWLRHAGDPRAIYRVAERALAAEWLAMAVALVVLVGCAQALVPIAPASPWCWFAAAWLGAL
jgi:hypothetical protein